MPEMIHHLQFYAPDQYGQIGNDLIDFSNREAGQNVIKEEKIIFDPLEHSRKLVKAFFDYDTLGLGKFPNTCVDATTVLTIEDDRLDLFLNSVNETTPIVNLSFKKNNSHIGEMKRAKEQYRVTDQEAWLDKEFAFQQYDSYLEKYETFIINDIGGKRRHLLPYIVNRYGKLFGGALEDTVNGGEGYRGLTVECPILLVDRTLLKNLGEDAEIGPSMIFSAQKILNKFNQKLYDYKNRNVLQIGGGNIGTGLLKAAKAQGCVTKVSDIDYTKLFGHTRDHEPVFPEDLEEALGWAQQIFVATNGKGDETGWGIKKDHWKHIRDGAKIGWGTSPDNLADIESLQEQYHLEPLPGYEPVVVCSSKTPFSSHHFFLYRGLLKLNFEDGGVVGDKIYAVQKLIKIGNQLLASRQLPPGKHNMSLEIQNMVAKEHMEFFVLHRGRIFAS